MRSKSRAVVDVDTVADDAFALAERYGAFRSSWHAHTKHQLLYAASGTMTLTVEHRTWMLPPQRAAWIAARAEHRVASDAGVELKAVYFVPSLVTNFPEPARVFAVTPLAREMILHAMRWPPTKTGKSVDPTRAAFFRALGGLCVEWMAAEQSLSLPVARTEELGRAMKWVNEHLEDATVELAARAAGTSVRTLARRFEEEAKMAFRSYLTAARLLRAMELLARPRASVSATAYAVGFQSLGAFSSAFRERIGETPSAYRARAAGL